jgi:hypothetical protein
MLTNLFARATIITLWCVRLNNPNQRLKGGARFRDAAARSVRPARWTGRWESNQSEAWRASILAIELPSPKGARHLFDELAETRVGAKPN